ncbi:MAG: polysaccharide biosynthesis tyrosine autokinase [Oscillospiraceae bacterium]|nr:polysaccharide biosynthesis tyrosine autokinase [Oscillospiraceae bacterium]
MDNKQKSIQWSHISPLCLLRTLISNLWMIVATALIFGMAVTLVLTWFHPPKYTASMTYSVNSRTTSSVTAGNLTSTREVAAVLTQLLETDLIIDGIRESDPRLENFNGVITASQVGQSNFIVVSATASTPEAAFLALDALVEVFPTVADYISTRNVLNVMRNPAVSSIPSNQLNTSQLSKTIAIIGALLMAVVLCYLSIRTETIQTRTGARQLLDAPIIASVCHERKNRTLKTFLKRSTKQVHVFSPTTSFAYTEQISAVCSQLEHEATARNRKVFMITGVGESEGKSTVAGNVAAALALKGHKVALVDCDLRKPAQNQFFSNQYDSPLPLNKLLSRPYSRDNLLQCMVPHEQLGLYMLFPTAGDGRSAELLSGETMGTLIQQLQVFDYVIIDTPPMGMFPDAEILAERVDASILVVRQDYTAACDVNDAIDTLRQCKAAFLGCILNDMLVSPHRQYGYGSRYGYGGKYSYGGSHSKHSGKHKSGSKDS